MTMRAHNDSSAVYSGVPLFLGVIDATTTSATNASGASAPFGAGGEFLTGKVLLIQTDAPAYIGVSATSTGTVTAANGISLAAGERVIINMSAKYGFLAAITASSTANVRVWELV